jgi:hypothetical protein
MGREPPLTNHVQYGLSKVAVQLSQAIREFGHIDSDKLIWVLDPVVQGRDAVESEL